MIAIIDIHPSILGLSDRQLLLLFPLNIQMQYFNGYIFPETLTNDQCFNRYFENEKHLFAEYHCNVICTTGDQPCTSTLIS